MRMQRIYLSGIIVLLLVLTGCGIEEAKISRPPNNDAGFGSYCELDSGSATGTGGGDPLRATQWYLDRLSIPQVWEDGITGKDIQIGIVDDGLEIAHEDLKDNIASDKSLNVVSYRRISRNDPRPEDCESGHGTSVAGIIAARADNGLGIKGVAHGAKVFGVNYLGHSTESNLLKSLNRSSKETAISSNSWGHASYTRLRGRVGGTLKIVINDGLTAGFGGKGISYVFAAGNTRAMDDDRPVEGLIIQDLATYEGMLNHPGIIPVCSVGSDDEVASYSNPGANLWVCGASDTGRESINNIAEAGLPTTDLSGDAGYNRDLTLIAQRNCVAGTAAPPSCFNFGAPLVNEITGEAKVPDNIPNPTNYHRFFTGTSAAAPTVSGIIALIRQAGPVLTWRDVKLILAETAEQVSVNNTFGIGWQSSGIALHNSSTRYTHHHDYGFGLVNALAAVNLARDWTPVEAEMQEVSVGGNFAASASEFNFTVNNSNNKGITFIEFVQVDMQGNYPNFGPMNITLYSPNGVQSRLANPHSCLNFFPNPEMPTRVTDCADLRNTFTFGTAAHLGENPNGTPNGIWRLMVTGGGRGSSGSATLKIYGHNASGRR